MAGFGCETGQFGRKRWRWRLCLSAESRVSGKSFEERRVLPWGSKPSYEG